MSWNCYILNFVIHYYTFDEKTALIMFISLTISDELLPQQVYDQHVIKFGRKIILNKLRKGIGLLPLFMKLFLLQIYFEVTIA